MQKNKYINYSVFLNTIATLVVLYASYLALRYAAQPLLDEHSFRQTQTALTSYWFIQEGLKLAYQTPVAGYPWSIPFEFPIYQVIVSYLSKVFNLSLDLTGRLTSYAFLLLSLFPVKSITKKLNLPNNVFKFFVAIVFSMPIYMYWGRNFMIETAALFFSIASIKYFVDFFIDKKDYKSILLFSLFSTLSLLQKVTTGLPVFGFLSTIFIFHELPKTKKIPLATACCFIIPMLVCFAWVRFSDEVKLLNPLGPFLTSTALGDWNWGFLAQRGSYDLWARVIWKRTLLRNLGSVLGFFLLVMPFFVRLEFRIKAILLSALTLGLLPLFLFTNLHIIHDYYQSANTLFFAYALAISLGMVVTPKRGELASTLMLVLIIISNYVALNSGSGYLSKIKQVFNKGNDRDWVIGEILKRELPTSAQFVAFGNDWSSTFAYLSQRKSFTVPGWFTRYQEVARQPEKFVEPGHLGGVVSCPVKSVRSPNTAELIRWATEGRTWKVGETQGCLIALPEKSLNPMPSESSQLESSQCEGSIDEIKIEDSNGHKIISLSGWSATSKINPVVPDHVFLVLSDKENKPMYFETLKIPRLDMNQQLGISDKADVGFSRLIPVNFKNGEYEVGVLQQLGDKYKLCKTNKKVVIPNAS